MASWVRREVKKGGQDVAACKPTNRVSFRDQMETVSFHTRVTRAFMDSDDEDNNSVNSEASAEFWKYTRPRWQILQVLTNPTGYDGWRPREYFAVAQIFREGNGKSHMSAKSDTNQSESSRTIRATWTLPWKAKERARRPSGKACYVVGIEQLLVEWVPENNAHFSYGFSRVWCNLDVCTEKLTIYSQDFKSWCCTALKRMA